MLTPTRTKKSDVDCWFTYYLEILGNICSTDYEINVGLPSQS